MKGLVKKGSFDADAYFMNKNEAHRNSTGCVNLFQNFPEKPNFLDRNSDCSPSNVPEEISSK